MTDTSQPAAVFDNPQALKAALGDWSAALGADAVFVDTARLAEFADPYAPADWDEYRPAAVVQPASVEEVQAVLRIANEHGVPIWVNSQGRNNGYGGSAPRVTGSVVVNLRRMNRILEINEELAYVVVEPGVSFAELYDAVQESGKKLWIDVPDLGWGSVIGNTLEHGYGYTRYGDHAAAQCGMEIVLPNGELIRTGLGAMTGNPSWHLSKRGYGPSTDALFMQSNMGVVTKMGMWVMPQPESYLDGWIKIERDRDLEALVDALRPLMIDGTIEQFPTLFNAFSVLTMATTREQVWPQGGPMPAEVAEQLVRQAAGIKAWNLRFGLYGDRQIVDRNFELIRTAVAHIPDVEITGVHVDPNEVGVDNDQLDQKGKVHAGVPDLSMLDLLKWDGGEAGGHLIFASTTPFRGSDARAIVELARVGAEASGFEYGGAFVLNPRFLVHIGLTIFNVADSDRVRRAHDLCSRLVVDAAALGYAEYRAHLGFMDLVADQFDFNDHAHHRLVESIKDLLDPAGILAPGKQGIWPKAYREGA